MKNIELLAPSRDLECGIEAIRCGADAVYVGANKYGARSAVHNSLLDIEKLIEYAHKFRAKVYVTVNTILSDQEILEAQKLINSLYDIGADAIIVQDMGLLELDLPPIPLFASTQTHNNSWQKVEFLEKVGFNRVILARELSLNEVREIKSKTNIDLEFFIHGALCVSYSGQCYLSYAIGGRSGNRGECAQPCRKKYSLIDATGNIISEDKYLLSLKDLNLSEYIKDLIDAGVSSFKVEGRLKDKNYIRNIVSFYRKQIDEAICNTGFRKSSSGISVVNFDPDPRKTFNRGYMDYFLNGRKNEISAVDSPKFIGEPVGKVIKADSKSFMLDSSIKLNNGDGISFFDEEGNLQGTAVNRADGNFAFANDMEHIKKGTFIYRNFDREFLSKLESAKVERKISVNIKLYENNRKLVLHAVDEDGIEALQEQDITGELAKNREMAINNYKKQLVKAGDTEFVITNLEIDLENIYFIPVKELNEARRTLLEQLSINRADSYDREQYVIEKNNFPYPDKTVDYQANVLNKYAKDFYNRHGVEVTEPAAESGLNMAGKKVMTTKHCLKYQFGLCSKQDNKKKFEEPLYLIDEKNKKYLLNFDCKNCQMEIFF